MNYDEENAQDKNEELGWLLYDRDKLVSGMKQMTESVGDLFPDGYPPEDTEAIRQWMIETAGASVDRRRAAALATLAEIERKADFYAEYIVSPAWKARADAAKARAGYRCQICNSNRKVQAHHRTYERLGNEADTDITVLCDTCHDLFHKNRRLQR